MYMYCFNSHHFIIHNLKVVACTFSVCHRHCFITVTSIVVTCICGAAVEIMLSPLIKLYSPIQADLTMDIMLSLLIEQ